MIDAAMETWKAKYTNLHVTWPAVPESHFDSVYGIAMPTGITMSVTSRSAAAMLTNKKLVIVRVSGRLVTMKVSSRFPVRATKIVMEYSTTTRSAFGPASESPGEEIWRELKK